MYFLQTFYFHRVLCRPTAEEEGAGMDLDLCYKEFFFIWTLYFARLKQKKGVRMLC
jgi:hypothetical protein